MGACPFGGLSCAAAFACVIFFENYLCHYICKYISIYFRGNRRAPFSVCSEMSFYHFFGSLVINNIGMMKKILNLVFGFLFFFVFWYIVTAIISIAGEIRKGSMGGLDGLYGIYAPLVLIFLSGLFVFLKKKNSFLLGFFVGNLFSVFIVLWILYA